MSLITPFLLFASTVGLLLYVVVFFYLGHSDPKAKFKLKYTITPILLGSIVAGSLVFSSQGELPLLENSALKTVGNQANLSALIHELIIAVVDSIYLLPLLESQNPPI